MALEELNKEVESFIEESYNLTTEYKKEQEELSKKVNEGLKGSVEVDQVLSSKKQKNSELLYNKAKTVKEEIETIREVELSKIEESVEPITADTLAELNLLSQLDLSNDDMSYYVDKYKRTPLALKKLQGVAFEKGLMTEFPPDRKERLNVTLGRMDSSLNRFSSPDYDSYDVKVKMVAEGAIGGHAQDIMYYRSL